MSVAIEPALTDENAQRIHAGGCDDGDNHQAPAGGGENRFVQRKLGLRAGDEKNVRAFVRRATNRGREFGIGASDGSQADESPRDISAKAAALKRDQVAPAI